MTDFHSCIEAATARYDEVVRENQALRAEVADLRKQIQLLQQQSLKSSEKEKKRGSISFFQQKQRIRAEWTAIPFEYSDSFLATHVSKDNIAALGKVDSGIVIFDTSDSAVIGSVTGHRGAVNCIVSDPETGVFASCAGDGNVHIWSPQLRNGLYITPSTVLSDHTGPVLSAAWIEDGTLVSGGYDGTVRIWDVRHSSSCVKVEPVKHTVNAVAANGPKSAVVGLENGKIHIFDARSAGKIGSAVHGRCQVVHIVTNDSKVISGGTDTKLKVWDVRQFSEPIYDIDVDHVPTKFDIRGDNVISAFEYGHMRLVDIETRDVSLIEVSPFLYTVASMSFIDSDSLSFIAASWDGTAAIGTINQI